MARASALTLGWQVMVCAQTTRQSVSALREAGRATHGLSAPCLFALHQSMHGLAAVHSIALGGLLGWANLKQSHLGWCPRAACA